MLRKKLESYFMTDAKEKKRIYQKLYHARNKEKHNAVSRGYYWKNRDKLRGLANAYWAKHYKERRLQAKKSRLKARYGITLERYDEILKLQNSCCAICGVSGNQYGATKLGVDHCHKTKKIRGLLCARCNNGIGLFRESVEALNKAIDYLRSGK